MKTITKLLLFTAVIFTASSCVTVLSITGKINTNYIVSITSDLPNTEVVVNENRYELPARVEVTRSGKNLDFKILQNDSVINDTILSPRLSNVFWFANLYWLYLAPVAWLVDSRNDNSFTYGRFIHIDSLGNTHRLNSAFSNKFAEIYFRGQNQQGSFNLQIALPHVNFYHLKPRNETPRNMWGFFGLGLGAEYFYRNNRSLQLRGDVMLDFPIPVPVPIHFHDLYGYPPREASFALNVSLTENFHINRFRLGYGLNFARNGWIQHGHYETPPWELEEDEESVRIPFRRKGNNMLGLALSTHYRFTNSFYLGVIYRPSFWELSRNRLMYEHTISVDFMWKIRF